MQKAARRAHAIRKMRRMARLKVVTKGLWTTGARAQGTYGHQVQGLPHYEVLRLRRQATQAAAGRGPG
eukprot:4737509-Pyramimonas_sp.AAC.1